MTIRLSTLEILDCVYCDGGGRWVTKDCRHEIGCCDCFFDPCPHCFGSGWAAVPLSEFFGVSG